MCVYYNEMIRGRPPRSRPSKKVTGGTKLLKYRRVFRSQSRDNLVHDFLEKCFLNSHLIGYVTLYEAL